MSGPHFGRHITPRWEDYIQDRRMNFGLFLESLIEDRLIIELRYELQFANPLVMVPETHAAQYEEQAWSYWEMELFDQAQECMDQAAWYGVACLLGVYQTAAAHRIVLARDDIENCAAQDGLDQHLRRHEEARACYKDARGISILFNQLPAHENLQAADRMMDQFVLAIEAVDQVFC